MKKQFFTFLMMIALVIVAGSAANGQEKLTPIIGNSYQYSAAGLNSGAGDDVSFIVTLATVNDDPAASGIAKDANATTNDIWWTTDPVSITDIASATASINITWKSNSEGNSYRLWIVVADGASGCSNYRFLPISPINFDISIAVIGLGTDALNGDFADITANTGIGDATCIPTNKKIGKEWDATATADNGDFYLYYRVKLELPGTPGSDWKFTPTFPTFAADGTTPVSLTPAFTYEYSTDLTSWSSSTLGEITVLSTDADKTVYIRVIRTLITERNENTIVKGQIASVTYGTYTPAGDADDNTANNTAANFTLLPLPQIGAFN